MHTWEVLRLAITDNAQLKSALNKLEADHFEIVQVVANEKFVLVIAKRKLSE